MLTQSQLSCSVELITPEVAEAYLSLNSANRPVKKYIVDFYSDMIRRGKWKENGESICFTADGKLADGQHRLMAIHGSGIPVRCVVVRGCEEGSFATYDSGVNRTIGDTFATAGIVNYNKISSIVNKYCAIRKRNVIMRGGSGDNVGLSSKRIKMSHEDLLREYMANAHIYDNACKVASRCANKIRIITETEMGAIMAYLEIDCGYEASTIEDFFSNVHDLRKSGTTAEYVLRATLLRDAQRKSGSMSSSYKQKILIKAWNAFVTGQKISLLRYDTEREHKVWFLTREEAEKIGAARNIRNSEIFGIANK